MSSVILTLTTSPYCRGGKAFVRSWK